MKIFCNSLLLFFCAFQLNAQINVNPNSNKTNLLTELLGSGISLTGTNTKYCNNNGTAIFRDGLSSSFPIDSGIILSTGYASFMTRNYSYTASVGLNYGSTDPQLYGLNNKFNTDICYLEFQFIPQHPYLLFDYSFGSEEYLEWVGSTFNDVFGFFITGPNPAGGNYSNFNLSTVPSNNNIVSINSINHLSNTSYYINNYPDASKSAPGLALNDIVLDGFTTKMNVNMNVVPGATYTIKIAIADVSDPLWDSYIALQRRSFRSVTTLPGSTLDLNWLSFKARRTARGNQLKWVLQDNSELDYFIVERSTDAIVWEEVHTIYPAIKSNINSWVDDVSNKLYYYRVKAFDNIGEVFISPIQVITSNANKSYTSEVSLSVVQDYLLIKHKPNTKLAVRVISRTGLVLLNETLEQSTNSISINKLKSGVYIVELEYDNQLTRRKIIKP